MKHSIVVDTSVIVKWLNTTNEENVKKADHLMEKSLQGEIELFAPELAKYELGNVLLKGKLLTPAQATAPISSVYTLPISFFGESENLAKQTFSLASSLGITYYDAAFISLAKEYNATLVTENIKHQGRTTDIEVLPLKNIKPA